MYENLVLFFARNFAYFGNFTTVIRIAKCWRAHPALTARPVAHPTPRAVPRLEGKSHARGARLCALLHLAHCRMGACPAQAYQKRNLAETSEQLGTMLPDDEELAIGLPAYSDSEDEDGSDHVQGTSASGGINVTSSMWNDGGAKSSSASDDEGDEDHRTSVPLPPLLSSPEVVCESAVDPAYRVLRFDCRSLSVAAFRDMISQSRHPCLITGLHDCLAPRGLTLERLEQELLPPDLAVPVRGRDGRWDASRFFAALRSGEPVYLADAPVARLCPWLLREVKVPRYFLHCFTHRTRTPLPLAVETPALFVGAAGTRSSLHVDAMCSNFWMLVTEGAKHWTTFHPDDAHLLSPEFDSDEQIDRFPSLAELEASAVNESPSSVAASSGIAAASGGVAAARRLDFELRAGEVLYIPHGTPHEVHNLSATVSVSANFLDQTNIAKSLRQGWEKVARREPGTARHTNLRAVMEALDEVEWPEAAADDLLDPHADRRCQPPRKLVGRFPSHERLKRVKPVKVGCGYARELAGGG